MVSYRQVEEFALTLPETTSPPSCMGGSIADVGFEIRELRRYPVKSMGGELLDATEIDSRGLHGDRWYAVEDAEGHFASGKSTRRFRRRDQIFEYAARTDDIGGVAVQRGDRSWSVGDQALDEELSARMGVLVRVAPEGGVTHQDAGQVSLVSTASLDWCSRELSVDADPRRLRVNVVLHADRPFVEEHWIGQVITVGTARLRVTERIERCRMIDLAQDGVGTTTRWLKALNGQRELCVGVYADVVSPGHVQLCDGVGVGVG